jgi:hypothetical protein
MAKYIHDFRVGDDYILKLTITDLNDAPVNITGFDYTLTLKSNFTDANANAVLQFTTTVGDNANDNAANGIVFIHVPNTLTKLISSGKYYYEIEEVANGVVSTRVPPIVDYKDKVFVAPQLNIAA